MNEVFIEDLDAIVIKICTVYGKSDVQTDRLR